MRDLYNEVSFEVSTGMITNITVFWHVTQYCLLDGYLSTRLNGVMSWKILTVITLHKSV